MNRPVSAVTFDVGGTLIDPWPSVGAVYAQVAAEFGWNCRAETLTRQFTGAWQARTAFSYSRAEWFEIVRESFAGVAAVHDELFDRIYDRFAQPSAWRVHPEARPTLAALKAAGLKLAVLSNWDDRLASLLEKLDLRGYFDELFVSSHLGWHKPDRRIFLHASEKLGIEPSRLLHVGDSQREDYEGARGAGLRAVLIRREGAGRNGEIDRLSAIRDWVLGKQMSGQGLD